MKNKFNEWYSSLVYKNLHSENPSPADLRLAVMKPLGAQWLLNAFTYLKNNKEIIRNGFRAAGITDALKLE